MNKGNWVTYLTHWVSGTVADPEYSRMISIVIFSLCCLTVGARFISPYSFSPAVGRGLGTSFASSGEGRITGVRVWETSGVYIRGVQIKHDDSWSPVFGRKFKKEKEMELFDDEAIVQISGKYRPSSFIYQLMFVTNKGRLLIAGQPTGTSFNFYPLNWQSELRLISGRSDKNGITSIAAHWGQVDIGPPKIPILRN